LPATVILVADFFNITFMFRYQILINHFGYNVLFEIVYLKKIIVETNCIYKLLFYKKYDKQLSFEDEIYRRIIKYVYLNIRHVLVFNYLFVTVYNISFKYLLYVYLFIYITFQI